MELPTNKHLKDLYEDVLGRVCTIGYASERLSPGEWPSPAFAVYVDDAGRPATVAMMEFSLVVHTGAALALIPAGGARDAVEDKVLPANLMDNTARVLDVLAAPVGDASGVHQRLESTYGPHDAVPPGVAALAATLGSRTDVQIDIAGYGAGRLSVVSVVQG